MFQGMIRGWFGMSNADYNDFIEALLQGDVEEMNVCMNRVAEEIFSSFDTGKRVSRRSEPERFHGVEAITKSLKEPNSSACFYHGFVLGLLVELNGR